ncbi:venom carboxylesterase-6 [Aedes aegypti]|uniref:Carboxylic ester hydrolase n=1 Tax=Aedes aegypti TaxID=7159 RepID=A0A6I8TBQ9_AEDAE|nr:venom carboxylesterase-6 [Aedes aegypti]XP_021695430.1 venom carboxylesterase-6 [Aedes aegypti]XP_021695431.1 venom carboxylesterase-6 [Aedes aegypti]XP_021695432.1 venom carboxylesterase-6 [Aedes aegypti]
MKMVISWNGLIVVGMVLCGLVCGNKDAKQSVPNDSCEKQEPEVERADPRVCIADGCLRGTFMKGYRTGLFEAFIGIPFAQPPVGKLRFANPVPVEPWREHGDYNASVEKSMCVQKNELLPVAAAMGSEDCLYLNVYRPKIQNTSKSVLPVMVYIHGGGYFSGSASPGIVGPEYFMDTKRVILVTIQYRVGVFGFLATGDEVVPGNFGLKDQSLALEWVKQNIANFGGNPRLVTIFGQSAGAGSVHMHMISPLSEGLFSRAIVMSGNAIAPWNFPTKDPLDLARRQAEAVGIPCAKNLTSRQIVDVLRNVDALALSDSISELKPWSVDPLTLYRPVVESLDWSNQAFLVEDPRESWQKGNYQQIPWMTGYLSNDGAVRAIAITTNQQLLKDLNANITTLLPLLLEKETSAEFLMALKQRFFVNSSNEQWITEKDAQQLIKLYTEAGFLYPLHASVKQHVTSADTETAPVSLYKFSFQGPYSYSMLYTANPDVHNFGVVHCDELIYLFRSPLLFPDFAHKSKEARMSHNLVKFFIDFAINGVATPLKPYRPCNSANEVYQSMDCDVLEFTNSADPEKPFEVRVINGRDEDMFAFWKKYYF